LKIIVNEALVKKFGFENPVGKSIVHNVPLEIIGVVKDAHQRDLKGEIVPVPVPERADHRKRVSGFLSKKEHAGRIFSRRNRSLLHMGEAADR